MIASYFPELAKTVKKWLVIFTFLSLSVASWGQSTRTWTNGNGNSRWTTATNWSGNTVPVAGDNVIIPIAASITRVPNISLNSLSVSANVSLAANNPATTITLNNVSGITSLYVSAGNTLTLGDGSVNNAVNLTLQAFGVGSDIAGNLSLTANTTLAIQSTTLNITGNLTGSGSVTMSSGVLNLGGNYSNTGTFTCGTGTVNYNGTGAQTVRGIIYTNITLSNSGTKTLGANATIGGNLIIQTGSTFDLSTYTANRSSAGGTLSIDGTSTLLIGGAGTFPANYTTNTLSSGSTVNYNGTSAQNIGTYSYSNLTVSGNSTKTLLANTSIGGNLTIQTGSTLNLSSYSANRSSSGGALSIDGTSTLIIGGAGTFPSNYTTNTLSAGSAVHYNGTSNQSIGTYPYSNLTISGNSTKTLLANTTVGGNLTIQTGSTLDLSLYTANRSSSGGTLSIDGTSTLLIGGVGTFPSNYSTNTLSAGSNVNYYGTSQAVGINTYSNLTLSGSGVKTFPAGTTTVNGILSIEGTATTSVTGTLAYGAGATLQYKGSVAQISGTELPASINNLIINNSLGVTLMSDVSINSILTLTSGIVTVNATKTLKIGSASGVISGGSTTEYIDGSLSRVMNNGITYAFPVGKSGCGYHQLTFSNLNVSAGSEMKVTFFCSGATTGDGTIANPMPININWHLERVSGTFTDATVKLEGSEIDFANTVAQSSLQAGSYSKITSTPASGSVTAASIGAIATDKWLAIGSSNIKTYYSYQTGNWNVSGTWTLDPSGTTQVGSSLPSNDDYVIILPGRTVTLPANIATTGLDITIEEGGFLDLSTWQFTTGLLKLSGQGTLVISSGVFPTPVTTNTFINSGGGTTEYRTAINLPSQATYNNLTINATGLTVTQTIDLTLNGKLYIKNGTFRINDNVARRLKLTVNGDVTVDAGAFLTVGTGVTNSTINPLNITGGTAPFINYYDQQSHRIVLNGNFTNNGTVRFTNLTYPVFNAFPPTTLGTTSGFATVYFQGASNNSVLCAGTTDFYNLVLDKGIDQTFRLTIYTSGSSYANFRLFGANIAGGDGGGANPNLKKALWIRTGTLVLEGLTIIPSLTEGNASEGGANPNSDFYIPANGSLLLNGTDAVVLSTADDYQEVNLAYNTTAPNNGAMGITTGGTGCAFSLYGKLEINNGYLSTRESGGIITSSVWPGQFIINNGTIDSKQLLGSTGSASYEQNGGLFILRGRFQRTPTAYSSVANLVDVTPSTLNNVRSTSGISGTFGTFNLNNASNVFAMSGGTIRIYDVCGNGSSAAQQKAFDVLSSTSNSNVTGGTLEITPYTGSLPGNDSPNFLISTNSKLGSFIINRVSSTSTVLLNTYPLILLNNFTMTSGVFTANNLDVTVGGNITIQGGTTYTPGTNTTILNGLSTQTFTVNLASPLSLNKFTIDKAAGSIVNFAGTQTVINVNDNFRLSSGTLNDNGNTIDVYKNVFNSGLHTGTGKIAFIGTIAQVIDGNGIFNNIELNNNTAVTAPVALAANMTINGALTFSRDKLFNIGIYNLKLNSSASIVNGGSLRYIQTAGNSGDGGLTKVYSATTAFIFQVGAPSTSHVGVPKSTPATIGFSSAPASYGSITVIPVGYEHPATTVNGQSLTYFWSVKSSGFTGIPANSVTHTFIYDETDVVGTESSYIPSLYDRTNYTWNNGTNANPPINTGTNNITDWTTPTNSQSFLDADYTAGNNAFGTPTKFYSRQSGLWGQTTTWWSPTIGTAATTSPGVNDIVIIRNGHAVSFAAPTAPDYLRVANTDPHSCASLQIETGATLDIRYNPSSNFGMVLSHPNGNGTLKVTTNWNYPTTYVFPSGDFSDFNVNMGTTELYTTNTNPGPEFYLPENVSSYGNLVLSPVGGSNVMFPNKDVLIYGDLITRGQNADSWFCPSWGTTYPGGITAIAKTILVKGNMDIQGGALIWYANGALAENFVIEGNVTISPLSALFIYSGATNQSMTIGGSLINNADGISHVSTPSKCDFTNITVTFNGPNSANITNTVGAPSTTFSQVIVDKGNSQATTLTLNIGGTLNTPVNNWLTLQNGTFKYMRNVNTDFTVSTATQFTIPATACFHSEYSTANNILIGNSATNNNDVYLNGKLKVVSGNVFIGPTNGTTANNNDIEYSGGGASEIEIQGGNLVVNGQIRQNSSSTAGILKYKQSGGTVTINGNAANTINAKLEVLNSGEFTMSAGILTILKGGGGSTYGDLYLRPATGSVTGGDIVFTNNLNGINQQYLLDANLPLNNLTITGRTTATAASATVKLMVNTLVLNGNLTLMNAQSLLDVNSVYNLAVTIKGNFTNNGTYNRYNNLTIFSGGTQSLLGSTATDFYDLNVSPVTRLTLSKDLTVFHDLSLGNGTLECTTFLVNLKGNIVNNATYTNTTSTSGIILNGSSLQRLSGTGTFGQLELNNVTGGVIDNSISLTKDLVLNNGIFDITEFLLTLGQNSNIVPKGTSFSSTKMITSDGVWSNVGIKKVFGIISSSTTFTYPLGTPGKYTPAIFTITANGSVGSIRVNNINSRHPAMVDPTNVLKYYWEVESTGISGFSGNLLLYYKVSDVVGGPESSYVAAQLLTPGTNWSKAAPGPGTDNVNETNHTITFNFNSSSNLTGQYTAGNDAAIPATIPQYTSNQDGNWTDNTIWTPSGGSTYPCPLGGPNGFIVTIDHVVTANANYCFTYRTTINNKLKVVVPYFGHNFGSVYGNGTLYLESEVFPAGRFASFLDCSGNGTVEYGGTGTYNINATLYSSVPRIYISGTGSRVLPDKDLIICKQLKIDDASLGLITLDNSINNRKLTINGTFERYNNGIFKSGTGPNAIVSFAGAAAQTIGGTLGDFTGNSAFYSFEINNSSGLTINTNGNIEVNGNLLLTNGLLSTSTSNKLTITNFSVSSVIPDGGSITSYVDGPLIKKLNQGDPLFTFPVGKKDFGLGNNLSLRATQTGTLFWVVEYFNPNTYSTVAVPLTAVNDLEYWNVSGVPGTSQAYIDLSWNNTSPLTPLMTQNGLSDMRVAEHNGTDWIEIASGAVSGSDNYNGSVETTNRTMIISGSRNYTLACVNTPKPRIKMSPSGPICGTSGIPVTLTTTLPIVAPFTVNYTEDGNIKSISPAFFPATIPTAAAGGVYILTGFTYNYPAGTVQTGVYDKTPVTSYAVPTTAAAGSDQSLCGATSATLAANTPLSGTGIWSIVSGAGGTVVTPTVPNSVFNGTNGSTYVLRWTISNGTCISSDDVTVSFPLLAAQPAGFSASTPVVCQGNSGVVYTVPNDPSVTYNWSYSGTGATINGTTNSITIDFNTNSTSGTLSVTATNSCNTSPPLSLVITVNQLPTVNVGGAIAAICQGGTTAALGGSFGGGATSAVWSDGGAGGTFANNAGGTPGTTTYTASAPLVSPVTLTLTTSGGSCGVTSGNKLLTVTANNTVTITSAAGTDAQTVCINTAITPITYLTTGATGATVTNLPTGVSGVWAGNVVTISGTPTVAGAALNYTVTLTGGCGNVSVSGSMAVTPAVTTPIFTLGATSTRCLGAGSVTYTATATNSTGITYSLDGVSIAGGNSIAAATGTVTYVAGWSGTSIITASAAGCNGPAIAVHTVTIYSTLAWTGTVSTDWNVAGNWSCGFIPDLSTPVQIPNVANKPIVSTGAPGAARNIVIDNSSSLTVVGNTMKISGTITNNGTFDATDGTIEMIGSLAQDIGANVFTGNTIKNLIINNPAGVTLLGPLNISGILTAQSGNLTSGGNLTLLSTATQTALINGVGNGNITGNVTMQRYLPSGFGYKYFSSPFQSATVNEFNDDLPVPGLGPFNFYKYDENRKASGWVSYHTPVTNPLVPLQGYAVNFGSDPAVRTVDVTGIVNNGNFSVILYNHDSTYTKGYNLVGNPYPSPIDWDAASGWTKTNIDGTIYYFKASTSDQYGGTYRTYINGVSSDDTVSNIIPSMQGFFVHVTDGGPWPVTGTLAMNNSVRVTDFSYAFTKKKGVEYSIPLLRLTSAYSDDLASADPSVIYFDEKASAEFDSQLDALKLMNTDLKVPNLYAVTPEGMKLSINALPLLADDSCRVPLGLKLNRAGTGTITIKILDVDESLTGRRIYISDIVAGNEQDLLSDKEFSVSLAKGEYVNRFFLNFSTVTTDIKPDIPSSSNLFNVYSYNGLLKAQIYKIIGNEGRLIINNLTGQGLFMKDIFDTGYLEFNPGLKDGIYIVSYITGAKRSSKKLFIQNR